MINLIKQKQFKKRSQAEILGLAVVFILIVVGILFYIKYSAKEADTSKQEFLESNMASNMLNSVLKTTTQCKDATVNDLVQDCAYARAITCTAFSCEYGTCTATSDSCTYLSDFIKNAFNRTFDAWGEIHYYFSISNNAGVNLISPAGIVCSGEKEAEISYIPTRAGTYTVELSICK